MTKLLQYIKLGMRIITRRTVREVQTMKYRLAIAAAENWDDEEAMGRWLEEMAPKIIRTAPSMSYGLAGPEEPPIGPMLISLSTRLTAGTPARNILMTWCPQLSDPNPDDTAVTHPIIEMVSRIGRGRDTAIIVGTKKVVEAYLGAVLSGSPLKGPNLEPGYVHLSDLTLVETRIEIFGPE